MSVDMKLHVRAHRALKATLETITIYDVRHITYMGQHESDVSALGIVYIGDRIVRI